MTEPEQNFHIERLGDPPHSLMFWIGNQGFHLQSYHEDGENQEEHEQFLEFQERMLTLALSNLQNGTVRKKERRDV